MPAFATLVDNFNDGVLGPEWGNAYGGTSEPGGRARVPCTTGYAGYQTGYAWTLAGSSVYLQLATVPAASTATAEAYCCMFVLSPTAGTRIGFLYNAVGNVLRCKSETGYYDPASVDITYSGTTHRWLRLRETGGNVLWDTSPDGSTWTNRRTLATPAWVTAATDTLALDLFCHRDGGTADYAEYDNVNTMANGAVVTGASTLTSTTTLTATAQRRAIAAAPLTAEGVLGAEPRVTYKAAAQLSAASNLEATAAADDSDHTVHVGRPTSTWEAGSPWM